MNQQEFNKWFSHFVSAFPAANEHVYKSGADGKATLTLWFGVLQKRELSDALTVTIGLFDGSLEALPGTERGFPDWSAVPRHVSRLCAEMHPVEPEWQREVKRKQTGQGIIKDDPQMAAAYADALENIEGGGTITDVRAMLLLRFPDKGAPERTPYREDEYQEI